MSTIVFSRQLQEYFRLTWTPEVLDALCNDGERSTPSRNCREVLFSILDWHCQTLRIPLATGQMCCLNGPCPPISRDIKFQISLTFLTRNWQVIVHHLASATFEVISHALILTRDAYPGHLQAHTALEVHELTQGWPLIGTCSTLRQGRFCDQKRGNRANEKRNMNAQLYWSVWKEQSTHDCMVHSESKVYIEDFPPRRRLTVVEAILYIFIKIYVPLFPVVCIHMPSSHFHVPGTFGPSLNNNRLQNIWFVHLAMHTHQ